jgi:hypothetical protein
MSETKEMKDIKFSTISSHLINKIVMPYAQMYIKYDIVN